MIHARVREGHSAVRVNIARRHSQMAAAIVYGKGDARFIFERGQVQAPTLITRL